MKTELEKTIAREYRRRLRELEGPVAEALRQHASPRVAASAEYALVLNATQNVLRNCIEATLQHAMPQGAEFFGEIAVRLAATVLTGLEPDMQDPVAMKVRDALLPKLADMQANGHGLRTEWQ